MWSSSGLFAKATTFEVWPAESRGLVLAFWRALFAGVLLLPFVRRPKWDARLIPLCLAFAVMNVMYLSSMTLTTAANAIWLQSTAPWWVFLVGVVILREPFPRSERIPLVIGGLGMAIILWYELAGQAQVGVLLGLISGFAYAGVVLSLRAARAGNFLDRSGRAPVYGAGHFPIRTLCGRLAQPRPVAGAGRFRNFPDGIAVRLLRRGLRSITSQEATGIGLLEPILLPLWVYLAWGEAPAPWTLVGGGLILLGLVLRYVVPILRR